MIVIRAVIWNPYGLLAEWMQNDMLHWPLRDYLMGEAVTTSGGVRKCEHFWWLRQRVISSQVHLALMMLLSKLRFLFTLIRYLSGYLWSFNFCNKKFEVTDIL